MSMKNPPHPGDFIHTEIIDPAGLSVTAAAAALKVSRPALSSLLNGKADLSGDMALRIEKAFGVKNGHAHADAVRLRHRPDAQAREANPRAPDSLPSRTSSERPELLTSRERDGYVLRSETERLHEHWPGSTLRWISAGHFSALVSSRRALCDCVSDAVEKL